jgi:hypothetical protein
VSVVEAAGIGVSYALTCVLLIGLGKFAYPPVKHALQSP